MSRTLEPDRLLLIKDGVLQLHNMRREYVTRTELMEQLRLNGVSELAQVRRAYLESNGEMSVIKADNDGKTAGRSEATWTDSP